MANYEVDILINGKPIKQFRHKEKRFVEGRKGSNFEIRFTNNTWRQIEVVTSVDGLSVINGDPCGTDSEGYLVPANESIVIPGWRLNNDAVAKFIFNDKDRSYASQMGHGKQNAGVIGFMVFEEEYSTINIPKPVPFPRPNPPVPFPWPEPYPMPDPVLPWKPWPYQPWQPHQPYWTSNGGRISGILSESSLGDTNINIDISTKGMGSVNIVGDSFGSIVSGASSSDSIVENNSQRDLKSFSLGTGWGAEQEHHVNMVDFTRHDSTNPDKLLVLYYDTRQGLSRRGIKVTKNIKRKTRSLPNPFPTHSESGATPPPGWKRKNRK